jgi:hypothetical protein
MTQALQKSESKSPVAITGTWDGVRHWLNAAKLFEQGKLFSQVMTGFELLALRKANGIEHGGDRKSSSHDGNLKPDWETILEKEAGLSQSTAYRYMDMAKAAMPRLKKLPALKNFDPFTQPMSQLEKPQQEAMATAVKKLTDGKSQADFFDDLYKQGGGNADAKGGKARKLTAEEKAAQLKVLALEDSGALGALLESGNRNFFLLDDLEVNCQVAVLEAALKFRRAWLAMPKDKRNPDVIVKLVKEAK